MAIESTRLTEENFQSNLNNIAESTKNTFLKVWERRKKDILSHLNKTKIKEPNI